MLPLASTARMPRGTVTRAGKMRMHPARCQLLFGRRAGAMMVPQGGAAGFRGRRLRSVARGPCRHNRPGIRAAACPGRRSVTHGVPSTGPAGLTSGIPLNAMRGGLPRQRVLGHEKPAMTTPYERIGGEAGLRRLTRRFYELMDELPAAAACRAIHPESLAESEQRLFEYLSYWFGGPPLFTERRGAPMLRARHLHAPIGDEETVGWLTCFHQAWTETVADEELGRALLPRIAALAWHMRNVAPPEPAPPAA